MKYTKATHTHWNQEKVNHREEKDGGEALLQGCDSIHSNGCNGVL
jgi:hypothetical protein